MAPSRRAKRSSIPTHAAPRFPQEMFDLFIDAVADLSRDLENVDNFKPTDRLDGLLACHLVSRSFCDRSRRHLFSRVALTSNSIESVQDLIDWLKTLLDLLTWKPKRGRSQLTGLAPYIKAFHASECEEIERQVKEFDATDEIFAKVLDAFHGPDFGIQEFSMTFDGQWARRRWNVICKPFQRSFSALIRSKHLRTLQICALYGLPENFLLGSHIKHLRIYECCDDNFSRSVKARRHALESTLRPEEKYPRLHSLQTDLDLPISYFESSTQKSGAPKVQSALSGLRSLSADNHEIGEYDEVQDLLSKVGASLRSLNLRYHDSPIYLIKNLDLTRFRRLAYIQLYHTGSRDPDNRGPHIALADLASFLLLVELPASVESLELVIVDGRVAVDSTQEFALSFDDDTRIRDWHRFDDMLASLKFIYLL